MKDRQQSYLEALTQKKVPTPPTKGASRVSATRQVPVGNGEERHQQEQKQQVLKKDQPREPKQSKQFFVAPARYESVSASNPTNNIPPKQRRLDSLAWLIQGDDICGAACFDGTAVLLATNKNTVSTFIKHILGYLSFVAKESEALSEKLTQLKGNSRESNQAFQVHKAECNEQRAILQKYAAENIKLYGNDTYRDAFCRALGKLTYSLQCSYLKPNDERALDKVLANAIRDWQFKFIYSTQSTNGPDVHAEMKLVDFLVRRNKLNAPGTYLGISKRCCQQCSLAIQAVNHVKKNALQEGIGPIEANAVNTRDTHGYHFRARCPDFLKNNSAIQVQFLKLMNMRSLDKAFNTGDADVPASHQNHLNSATDPCSLSDLSSEPGIARPRG